MSSTGVYDTLSALQQSGSEPTANPATPGPIDYINNSLGYADPAITAAANPQPAPAATPQNTQVNYSGLLPTAQQYQSFAPLSYQQFGATPQVSAATVNPAMLGPSPYMQAAQGSNLAGPQAATVDNSQLPGALQQYEGLNASALAPQFAQQNQALTGSEAQRGIFNSTAGQELQNNLSGQQDAALASANAPLVSQFAGAYNSNNQLNAGNQQAANLAGYSGLLSQDQLNTQNQQAANSANYQGALSNQQLQAQLQQQGGLANQAAYNNANQYNADAYGAITGTNLSNYNNYLSSLMNQQNTLSNGLLQGTLSSYDPSATGASSLINNGMNNAGAAYTGAYNAGSAGTANLASTFGQLGSALGSSIGNNASNAGSGVADMSNSSFSDWGA